MEVLSVFLDWLYLIGFDCRCLLNSLVIFVYVKYLIYNVTWYSTLYNLKMRRHLLFVWRFTYEVAPVFVLMETEVLKGLRQLVGWTEGDGLFCPGGSTSNMYAMNLARYRLYPEVKTQGLWGLPRLTVFTSAEVRTQHSIWGSEIIDRNMKHCILCWIYNNMTM